MTWKPLRLFGAVLAATGVLVATQALADADWPSAGANIGNTRYQDKEDRISAKTVGSLALKWTFTTAGDVTAHPAVDGRYLYFPDSAGFLYKVKKKTGELVWKRRQDSPGKWASRFGHTMTWSPFQQGFVIIGGRIMDEGFVEVPMDYVSVYHPESDKWSEHNTTGPTNLMGRTYHAAVGKH